MKADVAVVGSGLAALVATRTLQQAGRRPLLIWPGLSSLYFVFATVDVLGYADWTAATPIENPSAGVTRLIADQPGHPYASAGFASLQHGTRLLLDWFGKAGLSLEGSLERNYLLPTATGTPKPSCLVPGSLAAGDLHDPGPIVLCGFRGYQDFAPELAASNLQHRWTSGSVRAIRVSAPGFSPDRHFTSIDLARRFEEATFAEAVATQIREQVPEVGARIGLPAVLGLTQATRTFADFQRIVGHRVFEIPTLPPSVAALRIFDRLRRHLQETGVELIWAAPPHDAQVVDGHCERILLKAAGRELPIEAGAYVLALEDWVDGALRAGAHRVSDPFFHQTLAEHRAPIERTAPSLFEPQPFTRIGYAVSHRLQPTDHSGRVLADNVFVAGGALAGYDPSGTKSRGGMAVATGYRAAQEAMAA